MNLHIKVNTGGKASYLADSFIQIVTQTRPCSAVSGVSDSRARGPKFDTCSATNFRFSFKKGSCQVLAKVCARIIG